MKTLLSQHESIFPSFTLFYPFCSSLLVLNPSYLALFSEKKGKKFGYSIEM